jgi:hypothetical protein
MPRAAQWGSRVRSTGTVLGVRLLVLDVARHGSLVVLRRWSAQASTPETGRRNVYKDHFEPDCPYGAIEVVGQRHAAQFAQRRMVGTVVSGTRGRDVAGRTGFHVHTRENVAACTTAMASNTVAAPTESAIQRSWFTRPAAPSHAPDQSHRMASPVRRSFAGDVVAANLSRSLFTVRRTKVSDMSTRPL